MCGNSQAENHHSTRTTTTIGTWNGGKIFEVGKTAQFAIDMKNHNLAVLGINVLRWTSSGQRRFDAGELLLFLGHEEDKASQFTHTRCGPDVVQDSTNSNHQKGVRRPRIFKIHFQNQEVRIYIDVVYCCALMIKSNEKMK